MSYEAEISQITPTVWPEWEWTSRLVLVWITFLPHIWHLCLKLTLYAYIHLSCSFDIQRYFSIVLKKSSTEFWEKIYILGLTFSWEQWGVGLENSNVGLFSTVVYFQMSHQWEVGRLSRSYREVARIWMLSNFQKPCKFDSLPYKTEIIYVFDPVN